MVATLLGIFILPSPVPSFMKPLNSDTLVFNGEQAIRNAIFATEALVYRRSDTALMDHNYSDSHNSLRPSRYLHVPSSEISMISIQPPLNVLTF